jgi:hypothetical protein
MGSLTDRDKVPIPEPWANINRTVNLIHKLVETMETVPIGPMPKTESIPMLWETVKDLRPENLLDLQKACLVHGTYDQSEEKNKEQNLQREKSVFLKAEDDKKARDKRMSEEISSADESEASSSKKQKCVPPGTNTGIDSFNDEGTCATPLASA